MNKFAPTLPDMASVWQQSLNWQPNADQIHQFQQLYECILEGNSRFNLTRITDPTEFWEKHLWDSLRGVKRFLPEITPPKEALEDTENGTATSEFPASLQAIDIGTGAGFPGVPLAIALPHWTVTLLDSTSKKINFLQNTLGEAGIPNTITLVDRVELIGRLPKHREQYEVALVRAVAAASVCAEYALPLLKQGGFAVLYRGQWTPEEARTLETVAGQLGGIVETIEEFVTPLTRSVRHCVYLKKTSPTPIEFPRPVGIPTQKPLG